MATNQISPESLSVLLAPVANRAQRWSQNSGRWKDVFLLVLVDLWWIRAGHDEACPRERKAWHRGKHIVLMRGATVVDYSPGECEWMVKHGMGQEKFRVDSREVAARWATALQRRVLSWPDMLRGVGAGGDRTVGAVSEERVKLGFFDQPNLDAARALVSKATVAVGVLETAAQFTQEVGGAVPLVGAALQWLGFVLEVVAREGEEMGSTASAHSRLVVVGERIMEDLWRAFQENDEGYMSVLADFMQFIEGAARALEQFESKTKIQRLGDAFWQTSTGPLSVLQVVDECERRLNSVQTDRTHRKVDLILKLVQPQSGKLSVIPTAPDAVALEAQVAAVRDKLLSPGTKYVALTGMGGIGKTTLARAVVNDRQVQSSFSAIGFVIVSQNPNILVCQKRISEAFIDPKERVEFTSEEDGTLHLQAALKDKILLLVLDDLWEEDDLRQLDVVSANSRLLITTRIDAVANCVNANGYDMMPLDAEESHKLFCKCAFDGGKPSKWQEQYVRDIVRECDGLPLALEVMGREVSTYKEAESAGSTRLEKKKWGRAVKELMGQGIIRSKVFDRVFCLSFNSLDQQHQSALLDLAMLSEDHYARESDLVELQVSSGSCEDEDVARDVLRALESKSLVMRTGADLVEISEYQSCRAVHYHLHDVIRDSALKMMEEAPFVERNRLVYSQLRGAVHSNVEFSCTRFSASRSTKEGQSWDLQSLNMPKLQTVLLRGARIFELPASILVPQLVVLDLSFAGVTKLPQQICYLSSAKLLRVDGCDRLEGLPEEMGRMGELEVLSMRGCRSVYDLPNSVCHLSNLTKFLLPHCGILHFFPTEVPKLQSLTVLDLSRSFGLKRLPPSLGELASLTALNLGGCWQLAQLPASIGCLEQLEVLILHACTSLPEIPEMVTLLTNLEELDCQHCPNIMRLPDGIADGCPMLRILRLQGNKLDFPTFVESLDSLEVLGLPVSCKIPDTFDAQFPDVKVERETTMECSFNNEEVGDTPLHWAAAQGLKEMTKWSLKEIDADCQDHKGNTPLCAAVRGGQVAIVNVLVNHGASIDLADKNGTTPLCLAASLGQLAIAEVLLDRHASIEQPDKYGALPLSVAASQGHTTVAEMLLCRGASIDLPDRYGETPLCAATRAGQTATAQVLLSQGASIKLCGKNGDTPLCAAVRGGHTSTVEMLLNQGAVADQFGRYGETSLYVAACRGFTHIAEILLNRGASVDLHGRYDETPLCVAVRGGHTATAEMLLSRGASAELFDKYGESPLCVASSIGKATIARMLSLQGASMEPLDKGGEAPLCVAAYRGQTDVVEALLDEGSQIDMPDKDGETPLCAAARGGRTETAEMLLDRGASIHMLGRYGETPLCAAACCGQMEVAEMLINRGSSIDLCGRHGETPLCAAARGGRTDIVEMLINRGASIDLFGRIGVAPLCVAARRGHTATAETILSKGASIDLPDKKGRTALSWAAERGLSAVVELLLKHGADARAADEGGRTPTSWARTGGHAALAGQLEAAEKLQNMAR
ncbi:unnamed protein product [Ostreobium quekettii]|uniref:NB-ARC domain-containing protein n=1 Tax=Ostreobium quekettii TaxID=121088 RepID=A0A8S1IYP5_9CHLO|nr:unnamed protein product [Ostreobium quekettii]